jgi:hypothetical protein
MVKIATGEEGTEFTRDALMFFETGIVENIELTLDT